jgi:DNA ligase D-like protein (predicted ligase)
VAVQPIKPRFIEPMLLLPTSELPEGLNWAYELKLDGYRALAIRTNGKVHLRSRNNKDFNARYPAIVAALASLPDETVLDGELVALDDSGRPSFNALQNSGSAGAPIFYYVFDVLILGGRNLMSKRLSMRRDLLQHQVFSKLGDPVRQCTQLNAGLSEVIEAVRNRGLEGLVAKRLDSEYEPSRRSGAWRKMRINQGQEFVIGGYTPSGKNFDALIFGYYEASQFRYVARTRNGFTPSLRAQLYQRFRGLEVPECPFVNLPEARSGRWGQGLTAVKMKECRWLKPALVGQFDYLEWTPDIHLRHARFIALVDDRNPRTVRRKT